MSKMDWIENQNRQKNRGVKKSSVNKNQLRPVKDDGSDLGSKSLARASKAFTGIGGTKTEHKSNLAALQRVEKEDKTFGRKEEFYETTNALGRKVLQRKPKIVKAKNVKDNSPKPVKKVKTKSKSLEKLLEGVE